MPIIDKQKLIQNKLIGLEQSIQSLSTSPDVQQNLSLIDAYADLLYELLDRENPESYLNQLNEKSTTADMDFYLSTLKTLKKSLATLPSHDITKSSLNNIIADHGGNYLGRFDKKTLNKDEYIELIACLHPASIVDVVEVRTWGTHHEVSTGLKNVVRQQIRGEGVGHASVTMRIQADEEGKKLINQYAMNQDGSVKLPYEVKRYGKETVYEIYWSYWPNGLSTLSNDIRTELAHIEHKDNLSTLREMPLELKSRYLGHKYAKEKKIPIISTLSKEDKPVFKSSSKSARIMGLSPAATYDLSDTEPDIFRRNYLELKVKEFKLDEEDSALAVLQENYLSDTALYHPSKLSKPETIKSTSNFLVLLKRFHNQLSDRKTVAEILLNHTITAEQAKLLIQDIKTLEEKKQQQSNDLTVAIKEAVVLIQENQAELGLLKDQIQDLHDTINANMGYIANAKGIVSALKEVKPGEKTKTLTPKQIEYFEDFRDTFDKKISDTITSVVETKGINYKDAQLLLKAFNEYVKQLSNERDDSTALLAKKSEELRVIYTAKKEVRLDFAQRKLEETDKSLLNVDKDAKRFAEFTKTFQEAAIEIELVAKAHAALEAIDNYIIAEIDFDEPSNKMDKLKNKMEKTAKKTKVPRDTILFETRTGTETHKLTSIRQATELRVTIENHIKELQKITQTPSSNTAEIIRFGKGNKVGIQAEFSYHNSSGKKVTTNLTSTQGLKELEGKMRSIKQELEKKRDELYSKVVAIKLPQGLTAEELVEKRINRGNSNNAVLRGFDSVEMLKKASEIASNTGAFHLGRENCSSTCMKVLRAGAPLSNQCMFEWSEVKKGEESASNSFLTNPQSVYSAAKVVENAINGDIKAKKMIEHKRTASPDTSYNLLLNSLTDKVTTRDDTNFDSLLKDNKGNKKSLWTFVFSFLPHIMSLYRDFFNNEKIRVKEPVNTLEVRTANEIKALSGQQYHLINCLSAPLAIHRMQAELRASKTAVPFFETDTLARVEEYILVLEAKATRTELEEHALSGYQDILKERDARVECIEKALIEGIDVKPALASKVVATFSYSLSKEEKIDAFVQTFTQKYQEIRNQNFFSFLTANFVLKLDKLGAEDKLIKIQQHVHEDPKCRSARALKACLETDPVLKDVVKINPQLDSSQNHSSFFKQVLQNNKDLDDPAIDYSPTVGA